MIFGAHDHTNPKRQRGIQPFLPRWRFGLVMRSHPEQQLNQHPASRGSFTCKNHSASAVPLTKTAVIIKLSSVNLGLFIYAVSPRSLSQELIAKSSMLEFLRFGCVGVFSQPRPHKFRAAGVAAGRIVLAGAHPCDRFIDIAKVDRRGHSVTRPLWRCLPGSVWHRAGNLASA